MLDVIVYYIGPDVMVDSGRIMELGPFYQGPAGVVSAMLVGAIIVCALARPRQVRIGERLGMLMTVPLVLTYGRFLPVFAFAGAPLLAATLPPLPGRVLRSATVRFAAGVVVAISLGRIVLALPNPHRPDSAWLNRLPDSKGYPCEAADYVLANVQPHTGRIINEFGWGGYLCWRLEGKYQVMLDGRTQLYPPTVWRSTYLGSDEELTSFLASTDADAAVISQGEIRMETALRRLGWRVVYDDSRSQVFVPRSSASPIQVRGAEVRSPRVSQYTREDADRDG
jgi:hypothetical protein